MQIRRILVLLASLLVPSWSGLLAAPLDAGAVHEFIAYMASHHGFDQTALERTFSQASRSDRILEAMSRPAEKTKPWYEYRALFISDKRIRDGVSFWREHDAALARAGQTYGVAPEVIVAIIGVETSYGRITGSYRVVDALATLAFHYPGGDKARATFFRAQLEQLLLLAREEGADPLSYMGSYAGAMGMPQFMPENYRKLAVDFDADGRRDIWENPEDAIGSVANYLNHHGWQRSGAITSLARVSGGAQARFLSTDIKPDFLLSDFTTAGITPVVAHPRGDEAAALFELEGRGGNEYWIGYTNFYVISRYNPRVKYAMAVAHLAEAIRKAHGGAGS